MTIGNTHLKTLRLYFDQQEWLIMAWEGKEKLSEPFRFEIMIQSEAHKAVKNYLGMQATLVFENKLNQRRTLIGVITEIHKLGFSASKKQTVKVIIESRVALLKQQSGARVFLNKSPVDIVRHILIQHGYMKNQMQTRLKKLYPSKPLTLQMLYETDFDFIQRLLSKSGIYYWCLSEKEYEVICLCDDKIWHKSGLNKISVLPENALLKPEYGFFHMGIHHAVTPEKISIHDHDTLESSENIFSTYKNSKSTSGIQQEYYGLGSINVKQSQQWVRILDEHAKCNGYYLTAVNNDPTLAIGEYIHLNAEFFDLEYTGEYLIVEMHHSEKQNDVQSGYRCHVRCIPRAQQYRDPLPANPPCPPCLTAHIESDDEYATLDSAGRYQARFSFDLSDQPYKEAMPPVSKLVSAGGVHPQNQFDIGMHFPIQDNTEVIVGFLNDDPDRPVILGCLPNAINKSPVIDLNQSQNILKTRSGNQLLMEDKVEQEKIIFSTHSNLNQIVLDATKDKNRVEITSVEGKIEWNSKDSIKQHVGESLQQFSANDHVQVIQKNHDCITLNGNIHLQARSNIHYKSKNDATFVSERNMEFVTEENCSIMAHKDIQIVSQAGNLNVAAYKGDLEVKAGKTIHIKSSGVIQIGNTDNGIRITESDITLYGKPLVFSGNVVMLGEVSRSVHLNIPVTFSEIDQYQLQKIPKLFPQGLGVINYLHWSKHWVKVSTDVNASFMVDKFHGDEFGSIIIEKVHEVDHRIVQRFQVAEIPVQLTRESGLHVENWNYSDFQTENIQETSERNRIVYYQFHVVIDEHVSAKPSEFMQLMTDIHIELLNQHGEYLDQNAQIFLESSVKSELEAQIQEESPKVLQQSHPKKGKVIWANIPCGTVRFYFQHATSKKHVFSGEWLDHDYKNPSTDIYYDIPAYAKTDLTLRYLSPPLLCNIRQDADPKDRHTRNLLTLAELRSIQANGKNITIFVHGFNVPYGCFNKHITDIEIKEVVLEKQGYIRGHRAEVILGDEATIHRDIQSLKSRFKALEEPYDEYSEALDPEYLNGRGTHEWAIEMEHYLNRAAGFDGYDYRYFTRLIHFIWQGDTKLFDFMDSVHESYRVAAKLVDLIHQIHTFDPSIKIYLIAHSQGNGVVLTAMEQLITGINEKGEEIHEYSNQENILEHVFVWQASLPNNVLSPRQFSGYRYSGLSIQQKKSYLESRKKYPWFLPFAMHSCKRMTVLYSRNDNIVGPIPEKQPMGLEHATVNREKPFWSELVPALFLTHLGLNSIYQLASWIALPLSAFLNPKNQEEIFQVWKQKNSHHHYASTLDEQMLRDPIQFRTKTLYSQLRERLIKTKERINQELKKTGHNAETLLIELGELVFEHLTLFSYLLDLPLGSEMSGAHLGPVMENKMVELIKRLITLLDIMLIDTVYRPRDALGWSGPDLSDPTVMSWVNQGKIILADQTQWLYSHSGMKTPNQHFVTQIYQGYLIHKTRGIHPFGRYPS